MINKHTAIDRTPYTYLIIHKPSGLAYYGVRYGINCHPKDFLLKYKTSSKIMKSLLKSEGLSNFSFQIRKVFKTKDAAIDWEAKVNRRLTTKSNKFCNLDCNQQPHIAIQNKKKCKRISNPKNNSCITVPHDFEIPSGWYLGNINAIGKGNGKTKWAFNPITNQSSMLGDSDILEEGWVRGRPSSHSNSNSLRGKIWITNITTKENKLIKHDVEIPSGWKQGRQQNNSNNGYVNKNTISVNNGLYNMFIKKENFNPDFHIMGKLKNYPSIIDATGKFFENFEDCCKYYNTNSRWVFNQIRKGVFTGIVKTP